MQTPESLTARSVAEIRDRRRLSVRDLSAVLGDLGHSILPSGVHKIERGERRVDVGDLVALAVALRVTPNRLLLPVDDQNGRVQLTPNVAAKQGAAWKWANGRRMLTEARPILDPGKGPATLADHADFRRDALPPWEHRHDNHTAIRAARDLVDAIDQLLADMDADPERADVAHVRRTLRRVVAEVEALIGENGGQR